MKTFVTGAARLDAENRFTQQQVFVRTTIADPGDDKVTNGTFASDTGWTKGDGWTIAASVANCDGSQVAASALSQTVSGNLVENDSYLLTFTMTRSAGTLTPSVGGTNGTARSSASTFAETIKAGATETLAFTADADFVGTVDTVTLENVSVHWDVQDNQVAVVTLDANSVFEAPTNQVAGGHYTLFVVQDATGSRTATWDSVFKWAGGSAPTLETDANATDVLEFISDGTNMHGRVFSADSK